MVSGIGDLPAPGLPIMRFTGEYGFLSNFSPCVIEYQEITYPTLEHAFQAAKAVTHADKDFIANLDTPAKAKYWGRRVRIRTDWDNVKIGVMSDLLAIKFKKGSHLADLLVATGDRELIEGNSWHDHFWGVCNNRGENWLGKLLMARRSELTGRG